MKKQLIYRLACIVLSVVCCIVPISSLDILAKSTSGEELANQAFDLSEENNCCNLEVGEYISLETEQRHFMSSENIEISYVVSCDDSIVDYEYTQSGFLDISITIDGDNNRDRNSLYRDFRCGECFRRGGGRGIKINKSGQFQPSEKTRLKLSLFYYKNFTCYCNLLRNMI